MKVIDLLNKIANGEEVPKVIKSEGHYYNYNELEKDYYEGMGYDYEYLLKNISINNLNDEVETIEEDKKIEKITNMNCIDAIDSNCYEKYSNKAIALDINTLRHQINKIIDYIKEEK